MEEKLKELLDIQEYFNNLRAINYSNSITYSEHSSIISTVVRDIFTNTQHVRLGKASLKMRYAPVELKLHIPDANGGIDNINKLLRTKEIAEEWVDYKDSILANSSSVAYITVSKSSSGNVVITLDDPYA
jgi:hypothetical protein